MALFTNELDRKHHRNVFTGKAFLVDVTRKSYWHRLKQERKVQDELRYFARG